MYDHESDIHRSFAEVARDQAGVEVCIWYIVYGIWGVKIRSFSDLEAWQEAVKLAVMVYGKTSGFPKEEAFGLTSQLRRAAVSVSSNIAEGFSRGSNKDKIRFYFDARGSVTEIQSQLVIAREVNYITEDIFSLLANKTIVVHKLINGLIRKMKENENTKY